MSFEGYYQSLCEKGHVLDFPLWMVEDSRSLVCGWCKGPIVWINLVDDTNCDQHGKICLSSSGEIDTFTKTFEVPKYNMPPSNKGTWLKKETP